MHVVEDGFAAALVLVMLPMPTPSTDCDCDIVPLRCRPCPMPPRAPPLPYSCSRCCSFPDGFPLNSSIYRRYKPCFKAFTLGVSSTMLSPVRRRSSPSGFSEKSGYWAPLSASSSPLSFRCTSLYSRFNLQRPTHLIQTLPPRP